MVVAARSRAQGSPAPITPVPLQHILYATTVVLDWAGFPGDSHGVAGGDVASSGLGGYTGLDFNPGRLLSLRISAPVNFITTRFANRISRTDTHLNLISNPQPIRLPHQRLQLNTTTPRRPIPTQIRLLLPLRIPYKKLLLRHFPPPI